jgi:hypothetical protein
MLYYGYLLCYIRKRKKKKNHSNFPIFHGPLCCIGQHCSRPTHYFNKKKVYISSLLHASSTSKNSSLSPLSFSRPQPLSFRVLSSPTTSTPTTSTSFSLKLLMPSAEMDRDGQQCSSLHVSLSLSLSFSINNR